METSRWKEKCIQQWEKQCIESNKFLRKRKASDQSTNISDETLQFLVEIQHEIGPNDTLDGICLQYNVSRDVLKRHNKLHNDDIYFMKELTIPNPKTEKPHCFEDRRQEKVDEVMKKLKLRNEQKTIAVKLLQQCQWDVRRAITKYREDIEWQSKYADLLCVFENRRPPNPFLACKGYNTY